jgi:hypothetical protein
MHSRDDDNDTCAERDTPAEEEEGTMTNDPMTFLDDLIAKLERMKAIAGKPIRFDMPLTEQVDAETLAALARWAQEEMEAEDDDDEEDDDEEDDDENDEDEEDDDENDEDEEDDDENDEDEEDRP